MNRLLFICCVVVPSTVQCFGVVTECTLSVFSTKFCFIRCRIECVRPPLSYVRHAENFLGTRQSLLSRFVYFFCTTSVSILCRTCIYIYIIIIIGIQPLGRSRQRPDFSQATGVSLVCCILGKFLGAACHCFPPYIYIYIYIYILGQYVTLDRTFYCLLLKQEAVAAPVTAIFCCLSRSSRRSLL